MPPMAFPRVSLPREKQQHSRTFLLDLERTFQEKACDARASDQPAAVSRSRIKNLLKGKPHAPCKFLSQQGGAPLNLKPASRLFRKGRAGEGKKKKKWETVSDKSPSVEGNKGS